VTSLTFWTPLWQEQSKSLAVAAHSTKKYGKAIAAYSTKKRICKPDVGPEVVIPL
jgi:hypothetical protein